MVDGEVILSWYTPAGLFALVQRGVHLPIWHFLKLIGSGTPTEVDSQRHLRFGALIAITATAPCLFGCDPRYQSESRSNARLKGLRVGEMIQVIFCRARSSVYMWCSPGIARTGPFCEPLTPPLDSFYKLQKPLVPYPTVVYDLYQVTTLAQDAGVPL